MFGNRRRKRAHLDTATNGSESVSVAQTSESAVSPISNRQRLTGSNACGFKDYGTPENWFFHQVAVSRCAHASPGSDARCRSNKIAESPGWSRSFVTGPNSVNFRGYSLARILAGEYFAGL